MRDLAAQTHGWIGTAADEALAGGCAALWSWSPTEQRLRLHGAARALGLAVLGADCSPGALGAVVRPQDFAQVEALLRTRRPGEPVQARLRLRSGQALSFTGAWAAGGDVCRGVVVRDSAAAGESEHDGLTGLLTRQTFLSRAREQLLNPGRYLLVVADLDRLRRLNEALGHDRADLLLSVLGSRLAAAFAADALPARIGEDEFAVLARVGGDGDPAEALRRALEAPVRIAGFDILPTLAVGAVSTEGGADASDAAELLRRAELAVESAKAAGRGGGAAYRRGLESDQLSRLALEADLRSSLERREIEPFFQPIVHLDDGRIAGFEALMRWRHPRRGLLPPDDFIALAEEMGLMPELGRWMIQAAARQLARWRLEQPGIGDLSCSVNLSTEELDREGLVAHVAAVITACGLPTGALTLEITESQIMKDPDRAAVVLHGLREAGAGLALDDFGTGFSSLSYLSRLPFDLLKIDRYFVRTMRADGGSEAIVRSVTNLGRDLKLQVVAEGVESRGMAEQLLRLGCRYGQGYGYAPALPADEAEAWLIDNRAGDERALARA